MTETKQKQTFSERVPCVPLRDIVFFPKTNVTLELTSKASVEAIKAASRGDNAIILLAQKESSIEKPSAKDLYRVGTLAVIRQVIELSFGAYKVLCEGVSRVKIRHFGSRKGVRVATYDFLPDEENTFDDPLYQEALERKIKSSFAEIIKNSNPLPGSSIMHAEFSRLIKEENDMGKLADVICLNINLSVQMMQEQLEECNLRKRLEKLLRLLHHEIQVSNITQDITDKVQDTIDKNQKEYILREQIRSIQEELGETEEDEVDQLNKALAESSMPEESKLKVAKEIRRFSHMPKNFPETSVQRNWVELLVGLPFGRLDEEKLDIKRAREILDRDHYGLDDVKERILEYTAVRALQVAKGDTRVRGPILCLAGPPGVGKTSIAKSIAEALGRRYVRMSLGGIRDEAEIRGHRRTYVGAMPGRIIQGIRSVDVDNPLFLLDEVDKLGNDFRGDPSSALLEVLDPEQNDNFRDHYVELPYDLSKVLFITTANNAWEIPEPLLDRMELIEVSGYTEEEKIQIAKLHLLPQQLEKHALSEDQLQISHQAIARIISWYTHEAGVRQLDRELAKLCRRTAMRITEDKVKKVKLGVNDLEELLGRRKYDFEKASRESKVGVATGLAWTSSGGDTLSIEVNVMPGQGKVELTGSLGEVMKESAHAALTYVRSRSAKYNLDADFMSKSDIHIHVPAGAVPKDGPSAGVTMATAIASAISGRKIRHDLAMTGEITLQGRVMPIGGLKEKAVAARRAGIKEILIPKENERDLEDIPASVRKSLKITPVKTADEVLNIALEPAQD